ncbi:MAG: 2-oxoacid:acceptor oxidoreductase family protein [Nitrospirota bacterium]
MLRLRFHGRGGQGARIANRVLGDAAFFEGYYVQDFPLYGAARRGAPITAFARISKEPITERGVVSEPDVIIIMDETLLYDALVMPLSGLKKGGVIFINTTHSPEEAKAKFKITEQVITLDITKISLDMLGRAVLSTLAGGVASRIVGLSEDSLKKAVENEISKITADRELILKNINTALYCYNTIQPAVIKTTEVILEGSPVIAIPFENAVISSPAINTAGNTTLRKTGNWRIFKPVWDYDKCTRCMTCVTSCPDSCITVDEDGFPYTDYDNCKGCQICVEECPAKAIKGEREVHAW